MSQIILVAIGSAFGGVARYWCNGIFLSFGVSLVFSTLLVNVVGSFIIGFTTAQISSELIRIFLMVGICGGFTTFSGFSMQTLELIQSGEVTKAALNILGSVVLCVAASFIGLLVGYRA